jgi:hypothetical protein
MLWRVDPVVLVLFNEDIWVVLTALASRSYLAASSFELHLLYHFLSVG